ncbi:MAG: isocitrate dehydrogenase kinase/phosphatase AceK regulatory subunit, partial [Isosphaeraceae bacterium]
MWIPKAHNRLAKQGAAAIYAAFGDYEREFQAITRRAKVRFEQRDWHSLQQDALERLDLYPRVIARGVAEIRQLLEFSSKDKKLWATMKSAYADLIGRCQEIELAETFFNSFSRRIFTTIGVDPRIEFLFSDFDTPAEASGPPIFRTYPASGTL